MISILLLRGATFYSIEISDCLFSITNSNPSNMVNQYLLNDQYLNREKNTAFFLILRKS